MGLGIEHTHSADGYLVIICITWRSSRWRLAPLKLGTIMVFHDAQLGTCHSATSCRQLPSYQIPWCSVSYHERAPYLHQGHVVLRDAPVWQLGSHLV